MDFDDLLEFMDDPDVLSFFLSNSSFDDFKQDTYYQTKIKPLKTIPVHVIVKNGIQNFIPMPFTETCKTLWSNNIYTQKFSMEDDVAYISLDNLSKDNKAIFDSLAESNPETYVNNDGELQIVVPKEDLSELDFSNKINSLVKDFVMQDVISGYMNKKEFLMNVCNCEKVEGLKEYTNSSDPKIIFDRDKVEKTFEEYLKDSNYEHLYIPSEQRIYKDNFYLEAHNKYLNSINN